MASSSQEPPWAVTPSRTVLAGQASLLGASLPPAPSHVMGTTGPSAFGSGKDEEGHPCLQDAPTPAPCSSFRRTIKSHLSVFFIEDINSFYGTDKPFLRVSHAYLQAQSPGGSPLSAPGLATPSRRVLNWPSDLHGGREAHLCHCCRSVMSDSLRPQGLKHTRLPCPSLSPEFAQTHVH